MYVVAAPTFLIHLTNISWSQKKDLTQFRAHFHDIFLSARDCVCSKLGLGTPANIVFTVQSYKEEGKKDSKNILRKSESYPGHHGIVKLADGILTVCAVTLCK